MDCTYIRVHLGFPLWAPLFCTECKAYKVQCAPTGPRPQTVICPTLCFHSTLVMQLALTHHLCMYAIDSHASAKDFWKELCHGVHSVTQHSDMDCAASMATSHMCIPTLGHRVGSSISNCGTQRTSKRLMPATNSRVCGPYVNH